MYKQPAQDEFYREVYSAFKEPTSTIFKIFHKIQMRIMLPKPLFSIQKLDNTTRNSRSDFLLNTDV